ncbi:MAG: glutathione peroxidase [Balneolaceae bacterium]
MAASEQNRVENVYTFDFHMIDGKKTTLAQFEGDLLLIVNTASECGYTPQYAGLQELFESYRESGLTVVGFPANNFGGQEPGSDEEILQFCEVNYGVGFPLASKVDVRGEEIHPLFRHLTTAENEDFTGDIRWNFEKFLVSRDGTLLRRFRSSVTPDSDELRKAIEQAL